VCGILGLLHHDPNVDAAPEICEGLSLLQHRGQDAAGIITCGPKGRFYQIKANGMVRDIFDPSSISKLVGGMGVGHGAFVLGRLSLVLGTSLVDFGLLVQLDTRLLEASITLKPSRST
jgi:glucosamine 6-phosphate synthetase-like amidotransferase/phosphosugar isomerase protein